MFGLVYLTWTTRSFQDADARLTEETVAQTLASTLRYQHKPEIFALLGETKQCCYCISLYDVNSSDWTAKHLKVLSDLIDV